jgi:hypothetical protein
VLVFSEIALLGKTEVEDIAGVVPTSMRMQLDQGDDVMRKSLEVTDLTMRSVLNEMLVHV